MTKRIACTVGVDGLTMIRRRPRVKQRRQLKPQELERALQAKTLFGRVQIALDVPCERVAEIVGVSPWELLELQRTPDKSLGDLDLAFENALAYVNERLGACIALRSELENRLYKSRQAATARRQLIRGNE